MYKYTLTFDTYTKEQRTTADTQDPSQQLFNWLCDNESSRIQPHVANRARSYKELTKQLVAIAAMESRCAILSLL